MRFTASLGVVLFGILLVGCTSAPIKRPPAQTLTPEFVSDLSSSGPMVLQNARLITDNDSAFKNKLELIKNADSEIRLVYYKYDDDLAGSKFTEELIDVARTKNLKVRILVDFWNNYERLDLFRYIEKAGGGNIQVRFYGIPTESIQRAALLETSKCDSTQNVCVFPEPTTWFSKIFLSGLYSKNADLMNLAKRLSALYQTTPDAKALSTFAESLKSLDLTEAVDNDKVVKLAIQSLNSPLRPLIESGLSAPLFSPAQYEALQHVTDATRHRLMVVDGFRFQVGGRDIEGQEGFFNADFYAESAAALNIQAAYDRLFSFSPMVGDISAAASFAPDEYLMNPVAFQKSLSLCLLARKASAIELENCVNSNLSHMEEFVSFEERMSRMELDSKESAKDFTFEKNTTAANSWKPEGDQIESTDLATLRAYYVENLTFTKKDPGQRLYEPTSELANENGKYIHSLWTRALENTCAAAEISKTKKNVIIQTESFLLPGNILQTFGKMMNGQWNCKNVDVTLISNATTAEGSNATEAFSRYQLQSLLRFYGFHRDQAQFHFFEPKTDYEASSPTFRSKVSIFGDDMLIGSADATVRSYTLDTQSGLFVKNAVHATSAFSKYVDHLKASGQLIDLTEYYTTASAEDLREEGQSVIETLMPSTKDTSTVTSLGAEIDMDTRYILQEIGKPAESKSAESATKFGQAEVSQRTPASEAEAMTADPGVRFNHIWKSF